MKTTIGSFKLLLKNKNIFFTTIALDALFFVSLLSIKVISDYFAKSLFLMTLNTDWFFFNSQYCFFPVYLQALFRFFSR